MKKLRNLIAVVAMMTMAAVLTGCGDDDDDDDNDNPNPGPAQVAPSNEAELTAQNKTYMVTVAGQNDPITLTFPAAGQYQMVQGGVTETGTISGAQRDVNTWTLNVTPAAGQNGSQEGVLRLDFTSAGAGTWTFTPTGGQAETGSFTVTTNNPGSTDGNTDGNPVPTGVEGKTLQLNYPNGGGEKFQFTSATAVSYENGLQTGTYTYDDTNKVIHAVLGNGTSYDITLTSGTAATVVFRPDPNSPPTTDQATYTLQ